ncbi:MAG TPA: MBL fold metallo-hydrolase [Anaerolineales bacterium]|nr:MBL fold metallo-hydrolase [Anaerolineales bacterium]
MKDVYALPGVIADAHILVDTDGPATIGSGIPRSEKKILAYLGSLGKSPNDGKPIFLTHSEIDHVGSLAALQSATAARTYATRIEADAIPMEKPSRAIRPTGFSMQRIIFGLLHPFMEATSIKIDEIVEKAWHRRCRAVCARLRLPDMRQVTSRCSHILRGSYFAATQW